MPSSTVHAALNDVTLVTVLYNSAHCVSGLVDTMSACPHIMVVDNASDDGGAEALAKKLPQAVLIRNMRNLGYGAANNQALEKIETPYALLLNPDCIADPATIAGLVESARVWPEAAMFAPQLMDAAGKLEINYRWSRIAWASRGKGAVGPCCVGFVTGAALLLNMQAMREIGFFDEAFFLYYEDDDLCQRVFAAGKAIMLLPSLRVTHLSRGSVRGGRPWRAEYWRGFHHAQSKILFTAKHAGLANAKRLRWRVLCLALLALPLRCLLPHPKYVARMLGRIAGVLAPRWPDTPHVHHPMR